MPLPADADTPILAIADVKAYLQIPPTNTARDVVLQAYIDGALEQISYIVGPLTPSTFTDVLSVRGATRTVLRRTPVVAVLAATEYAGTVAYTLSNQPLGSTADNYGYSLDLPEAGLMVRRDGAGGECYFLGDTLVVTYSAGIATLPANVHLAAMEDIRGLWQLTQQGGNPAFGNQDSEAWQVGPTRLFPRLAALLAGAARTPGIA